MEHFPIINSYRVSQNLYHPYSDRIKGNEKDVRGSEVLISKNNAEGVQEAAAASAAEAVRPKALFTRREFVFPPSFS